MRSTSTAAALLVFLAAGAVGWLAGVKLSDMTDVLATRLGLGEALGGVLLLAVAMNLPEIAFPALLEQDAANRGAAGILGLVAIATR